ncbi:hypothetical protein L195_g050149 [Trifolium pratense]|uniref:Uncharacterized protein n=1 Tax=Trifolium pratense TaxID=57577 RepID=A0A2K3JSD6_TRIPR|nr:hypothetical protein L195_g050149 [Trifolium pratense]
MLPKARDGEDFMERGKTLANTNLGSSDTKEHPYEMPETGQKCWEQLESSVPLKVQYLQRSKVS